MPRRPQVAKAPAATTNTAKIPTSTSTTNKFQQVSPTTNTKLKVDINVKNDHVIVDITGSTVGQTKLNIFDAVKAKDFDSIFLYVKAGGNVNVKNEQGYTPLMLMIQESWKPKEMKLVLEKMPNTDLTLFANQHSHSDSKYGTPIDMAVKLNDVDLVRLLSAHAGKLTLNKHIEGNCFTNSSVNNPEIFKILFAHLNEKDFTPSLIEHTVNTLMRSNNAESVELIHKCILKVKTLPEVLQHSFLFKAAYFKNEKAIEMLLSKNYINKDSIFKVLQYLASQNDDHAFKYVFEHVNNKNDVIDLFNRNPELIKNYEKYAVFIGSEKPGTIYISDVVDTSTPGNLHFKDNKIHVDVTACQHGQCVHVETDVNPQMPKVIEGVVV